MKKHRVKISLLPNQFEKKSILLISVGQKYHEGDKLEATVHAINEKNLSQCNIVVADTLQRHNHIDITEEKAYSKSIKKGEEWIYRNYKTLEKLKCNYRIIRWNEVLNHPEYLKFQALIRLAYLNSSEYRTAIKNTILSFIRRKELSLKLFFPKCLSYIIEEVPVIMPIFASMGYDYIIYPKKMTPAMAATKVLFVDPFFKSKVTWKQIKFY